MRLPSCSSAGKARTFAHPVSSAFVRKSFEVFTRRRGSRDRTPRASTWPALARAGHRARRSCSDDGVIDPAARKPKTRRDVFGLEARGVVLVIAIERGD